MLLASPTFFHSSNIFFNQISSSWKNILKLQSVMSTLAKLLIRLICNFSTDLLKFLMDIILTRYMHLGYFFSVIGIIDWWPLVVLFFRLMCKNLAKVDKLPHGGVNQRGEKTEFYLPRKEFFHHTLRRKWLENHSKTFSFSNCSVKRFILSKEFFSTNFRLSTIYIKERIMDLDS